MKKLKLLLAFYLLTFPAHAEIFSTSFPMTGSGGGALNLGTSLTANNPQISGDATSGLYTAGAGKVDIAIAGVKIGEWASTGYTATQPIYIGSPSITDTGVAIQATGLINGYYQSILQNTSSGTSASADYIVNNNLGTSTTYYGDFGINSSTYTGSGSFNLPNATFLASQSGDLTLGTFSNNSIHLVVNNGATDAMLISGSNAVTIPTGATLAATGTGIIAATTVPETGVSATATQVAYADSTGFLGGDSTFTFNDITKALSATSFIGSGASLTNIPAITRSINSISTTTTGAAVAFTDYVYLCTGTFTYTQPTAVGNADQYDIINAGSGTITVTGTSSQKFSGASTIVLTAGQSATIISNNSNWFIK